MDHRNILAGRTFKIMAAIIFFLSKRINFWRNEEKCGRLNKSSYKNKNLFSSYNCPKVPKNIQKSFQCPLKHSEKYIYLHKILIKIITLTPQYFSPLKICGGRTFLNPSFFLPCSLI